MPSFMLLSQFAQSTYFFDLTALTKNYTQQFDIQEFLSKNKVEFWTWKEQKNGTVVDTTFDYFVFPIQLFKEYELIGVGKAVPNIH